MSSLSAHALAFSPHLPLARYCTSALLRIESVRRSQVRSKSVVRFWATALLQRSHEECSMIPISGNLILQREDSATRHDVCRIEACHASALCLLACFV